MEIRSRVLGRQNILGDSMGAALGKDATAGFSLWREAMRWQRGINAALRPVGLTHTQFLVLSSLARAGRAAGDAVAQRTIADLAGLDESTTSGVLKTLEGRGLVDRSPTDGDGRAWRVVVSASGQKILRRSGPLVTAAARRFRSERDSRPRRA
jgi:DNA-binding MarR family transcriptional regulator